MYKTLTIVLLVIFGLTNAVSGFNVPSDNLQRLTPAQHSKAVKVNLCPWCINEAVDAINVLLNLVLDEGIVASCGALCGALANKTGSAVAGDICLVACDGLGIDEFVRELIKIDIDPIWYCELADLCASKSEERQSAWIPSFSS